MQRVPTYRERPSTLLPATVWESTSSGAGSIILPDGCMDIIWDGEDFLVAGPDTAPHAYRPLEPRRMTAVRFQPGVAPGVLRTAAHEVRNARPALADLWSGHRLRTWRAAMLDSSELEVTLEHLVATAYDRHRAPEWVLPATRLLESGSAVATVARKIDLSPRQLQRCASERFGYGPKMLQRILRVRSATAAIDAGRALSDVAADHGYADYAHLHRETRALLGRSPRSFRQDADQLVGSGA